MKKHLTTRSLSLAAMLCVGGLTTEDLAQLPVVTFENGSTTLITYGSAGNTAVLPANEPGKFYFALLTSDTATGPFTFAGAYGTNSACAGHIAEYSPYVVLGWAPCVSMFYEVAGWSSDLGATWNPRWLVNNAPASPADSVWGRGGYFGLSGIASGSAGCDEPAPIPPMPLFGGSGLQGLNLAPVGAPELNVEPLSPDIVISWSTNFNNWILESAVQLGTTTSWFTVTNNRVIAGTSLVVTDSAPEPARYYRLRTP